MNPNYRGHHGCNPVGWSGAARMADGRRDFAGGFGRGERGGRRRLFDSGELRLVLLRLLADQPRHGYDLIRAIEELTGGAYAPSPGIVYPTITLLLDMGQIAEEEGGGTRKTFTATAEGRAHLADRQAEVDAIFARLAALATVQERTDAAPVRRAMHNLKAVLINRLGQDGVTIDTIHDAVALIDEAAGKIERLK